ncbi:MAG: hypothetical protein AAGE80_00215 [Pseudomonadota bacterium]
MYEEDQLFPEVNASLILTILLAGAMATVAFDFFGQTISPLLKGLGSDFIGAKLAPVPLAQSVLAKLSGIPGKDLRALGIPHGMHVLTGLIAYPLGWLLIARPIYRAILPDLPWVIPAVLYGVALWVFALYFMAHLVAGNPPFLGFGGITWVALWGHIVFAVVAAWVIQWRERSLYA